MSCADLLKAAIMSSLLSSGRSICAFVYIFNLIAFGLMCLGLYSLYSKKSFFCGWLEQKFFNYFFSVWLRLLCFLAGQE